MSRNAEIRVTTPVIVEHAIRAFGTPARVHLIRYYLANPGASKASAISALGLALASAARNIDVLLDVGVLVAGPGPDRRTHSYTVNQHRLQELLGALGTYVQNPM